MADISKIKLPDGATYNVKDTISGYITAETAPVTSVNGDTGDVTIIEGLEPLIGTTSTVTPQQVVTALGEGRDICITATASLDDVPLELKFTNFNRATDTVYSGQAIDVVVSQTIASYNGKFYLFELVGGILNASLYSWQVISGILATEVQLQDVWDNFSNYVPNGRTINDHQLTTDISISASDVGAVPTIRTVNGKALSSNIILNADDVGALNGNTGGVFYGTCSTGAGTAAKVVKCADFTAGNLKAGTIIVVTFTVTNSGAVANLTMNVNGTGAKPIKYVNNGTLGNLVTAGHLKGNTEYPFYYDGANWVVWFNYNTTYSEMSENEMHTGTSASTRLITAQRLKQAVQYHAPVTSVNGSTGAVTINVPTNYDAGLVKAWYYHSAAATGFTTGSDENAITVNSRTTTEGRYYGVETDTDGLMFVNVPWTSSATNWVNGSAANSVRTVGSKVESSSYTIGDYAVAEGYQTEAGGNGSHAEGWQAKASGQDAHAEGASTIASGWHSHAEGYGTIANHNAQHVFGKFNRAESSATSTGSLGNYVEIVGNGESNLVRSNARTLDWAGNEVLAGKLTVGAVGVNSMDVATVGQIPNVPSWAMASTKPTYTANEVGALPATTTIPSKTSELTNDSGFITSSALPTNLSDLTNDCGFAKIHISTAEPTSTDGVDGDIWITYSATS